jgi:hypothetical protein
MNGKKYGSKSCNKCKGTGRTKGGLGKGQCTTCHGFKTVVDFNSLVNCDNCGGTNRVPENECNTMPNGWLLSLPIKVLRTDRKITWGEAHLGYGLYSHIDYGAYKRQTDEDIIASVREHKNVQLCKVYTKEKGFATGLAVVCGDQGYSVVPTWNMV